ncbi:MAG: phosphate ABC transporter ATP-binding protein [Elusimicrobia bacterium]|nr:phosphate ABC transporter ATP-binding protein [Elusimicrobiota bacterium]
MTPKPKLEARQLHFFYGTFAALKGINLAVPAGTITAIIGPSGCGKSTLLRVFNRMNEIIPDVHLSGDVLLEGVSIYQDGLASTTLRKRVGMVFQRPNPFPLSIFENVAYGPRIHGLARGDSLRRLVEESLQATHLWDEVKDRLSQSALSLLPEQQQRLCISRLLAVQPEVLLLDEPCSALDPAATQQIEELMRELTARYTLVIVTHNMQQAARVSEFTAYMLLGELAEFGKTAELFTNPRDPRTEEYITGRFG